ncbi:MAG TPA: hypothetical protein H9879_02640 [Candidatus Alistipes intestinipullorum]|nr:hypothetical protein [Candidatus Alistipes intestinipullorum]
MKPMMQAPKEPSDEERRWRIAAENTTRVKQHLKILYMLFSIWCVLTVGWGIAAACKALSFRWTAILILSAGFLNIVIGIVNNRRVLAGKKPW